MPFIIDHRAPALPPNHEVAVRAVPISSFAVVTIQEARHYAHDEIVGAQERYDDQPTSVEMLEQWAEARAYAIDSSLESAVSIGPLPDGTTIEVCHVAYPALAEMADVELQTGPWPGPRCEGIEFDHARIITSYNARQEG